MNNFKRTAIVLAIGSLSLAMAVPALAIIETRFREQRGQQRQGPLNTAELGGSKV
jgi:hypothetical protein